MKKPYRVLTAVVRDMTTKFRHEFGDEVPIQGFMKTFYVAANDPAEIEERAIAAANSHADRIGMVVDHIDIEEISPTTWLTYLWKRGDRGATFFQADN